MLGLGAVAGQAPAEGGGGQDLAEDGPLGAWWVIEHGSVGLVHDLPALQVELVPRLSVCLAHCATASCPVGLAAASLAASLAAASLAASLAAIPASLAASLAAASRYTRPPFNGAAAVKRLSDICFRWCFPSWLQTRTKIF